MAVSLQGFDPWPDIGAGGSAAGDILGGGETVTSMLGGDWLSIGMKALGLFGGGSTKISGAAGAGGGQGVLNTSGWVVGQGDALGGATASEKATASLPVNYPWYAWAAFAVVVVAIIKKTS